MECDVIPDCTQEVDPLGNLDNCDPLSDESCSYGGALNAQIISSTHSSFIIHPSTPQHIKISADRVKKSSPTNQTDTNKSTKHKHGLRKMLSRPNATISTGTTTPTSLSISSIFTSPTTAPTTTTQASTMREVLASIPGFSIKPRRRSNKKVSAADQLEAAALGCIDLETPDSILVGTNLRDLLNRHTFSLLPPLYQYKLIQLLPNVDRPVIDSESPTIRLNSSSLNNEFFARACLEWPERLKEGEFTPENQLKLRSEAEKEKSKLDPWKLKHFEPIWGDNGQSSQKVANHPAKVSAVKPPSTAAAQTMTAPATTSTTTTPTNATTAPDVKLCGSSTSSTPIPATSVTKDSATKKAHNESSSAAELNLTPITTTTTTIAYTTPSSLSPSGSAGTSYTTSSGRLIKSPSSYSSLTYAQQQKRQRTVGAVTRSSASTSTTIVVPQPQSPSDNLTKVIYCIECFSMSIGNSLARSHIHLNWLFRR